MSKRQSLIFQVKENLKDKQRFNQSRSDAKEELRDQAKALGVPLAQMPTPGIFSKSTYESYLKQDCYFVKYVKEAHPEVQYLSDCKQYAKEYLEFCQDRGDSAWTLKTSASAIAKLYDCRTADLGVDLPQRKDLNRTRSATDTKYDAVIERRYRDIVDFMKNTGLRRTEAEKLKLEHISSDFRYIEITDNMGKGGRDRTIEVIDPSVVEKYIQEHKYKTDLLFGNLDKRLDIHSYRHDYANTMYEKKLSEKYARGEKTDDWYRRRDRSGRKYDREICREVSRNLGHDRVDTTIVNYLK